MTAPDWTAIATRFHTAAAKLIPLSARMSGVAKRLAKPTCPECKHGDFIHVLGCSRAMAGTGNTALQFGRAVVRAERLGYIREERKTDDGRQIAVAQATKTGRAYSEFRANAALVAAAPDLLALAERWLRLLNDSSSRCVCVALTGGREKCCRCAVESIIRKARGES